jgi:hypothetical protein
MNVILAAILLIVWLVALGFLIGTGWKLAQGR